MSFRGQISTADHAALMVQLRAALATSDVPFHLRGGLERYFDWGILPGGFLQSVLCNDRVQAVMRHSGAGAAFTIVTVQKFLLEHAPFDAWGSREKVLAWTTTPDRLEI